MKSGLALLVVAFVGFAGCSDFPAGDEIGLAGYHVLLHPPAYWMEGDEFHFHLRLSTPMVPEELYRPIAIHGLEADISFSNGGRPVPRGFEADDDLTARMGSFELEDGETVGVHGVIDMNGSRYSSIGFRLDYRHDDGIGGAPSVHYDDACLQVSGNQITRDMGPKLCKTILDTDFWRPEYGMNIWSTEIPPPQEWHRWTHVPEVLVPERDWMVENLDRPADRYLDKRVSCFTCDHMSFRIEDGLY